MANYRGWEYRENLSDFLKRPKIREKLASELTYPVLAGSKPLLVPRINPEESSTIGTAFDYLLRLYILQINKAKCHIGESSIPDTGFKDLRTYHPETPPIPGVTRRNIDQHCYWDPPRVNLSEISLKRWCLGKHRNSYFDLSRSAEKEISELFDLVDAENFKSRSLCILQSKLTSRNIIWGATPDIILDDAIIEIKTVNRLTLDKPYINQLLSYYILSKVVGFTPKTADIHSIGIYFSRFGYLWKKNITDIIDRPALRRLESWFVWQARRVSHRRRR